MEYKQKNEILVKELVKKKIKSQEDFLVLLKNLTKKYQIAPPSIVEILTSYKLMRSRSLSGSRLWSGSRKKVRRSQFFEKLLKKRPIRSLSGVAVISVLTKPYPCPGKCLYCPTEKGIPKSYLSGEPAVERAKLLKFDPYLQVKKRIEALQTTGHPTDKIELIIIGASWTAYPKKYQLWFIKRCFEASNGSKRKQENHRNTNAMAELLRKLKIAQKRNEKAKNRIIGISIETRPDLITPEEIKRMRELGVTKIELGIQALDDKILAKNKRGHGIKEIIAATKLLKDAGFKICYHIMPGLLGSNPKKDLLVFKKIFSNSRFQPDYLKIYPCVVTRGSKLYKLWQQRKYKPYSDKILIELLIKMKENVPPYVRIIRIFRDIPSPKIEAGTKISNLREVVKKEMKKRGLKCQCIRCREIKDLRFKITDCKLVKREYKASEGKEIFLSFEDKKNDKILAFLRLRLPQNYSTIRTNRRIAKNKIYQYFPVLEKAALIRELHTYGPLVEIGKKNKMASQHQSLGRKLVKEAEKIVKDIARRQSTNNTRIYEYSSGRIQTPEIAVISGIGARPYWRKLGYKPQETYMVKNIRVS